MAFGYVTYKNFAPINSIVQDLTGSEGCGVYLYETEGRIKLATGASVIPYGLVAVGSSTPDGQYPGAPVAGSLEVVDQIGCAVQVRASDTGSISAGDLVLIDTADANGTFVSVANQAPATGDWIWGLALTDCEAGEQFILRFQPYIKQYTPAP
jgi:hypothetical protein